MILLGLDNSFLLGEQTFDPDRTPSRVRQETGVVRTTELATVVGP